MQQWLAEPAKQTDIVGSPFSLFEKALPMANNLPMLSTGVGSGFKVDQNGIAHPAYWLSRAAVYDIAATHTALRSPIDVVVREMLINGFVISPLFAFRCDTCGYEYKEKPREMADTDSSEELKCTYCGGTKFSEPDPSQRLIAMELTEKKWNKSDQSITDVMSQLARDIEIIDDGYLYFQTSYKVHKHKIIQATVNEIYVLHPPTIYMICDNMGVPHKVPSGKYAYVCVKHRRKVILKDPQKDGEPPKDPRCDICHTELLQAACIIDPTGALGATTTTPGFNMATQDSTINNDQITVLAKDEIIVSHGKYNRSRVYGLPIAITCIQMLRALYGVETYFEQFFDRARPPKSLTLIGTRNIEQVRKQLDILKERLKHDPYELPIVITPIDSGTRRLIEHVNLTGPLSDLQLSDMTSEYRRIISSMFGIMPLYQGETENWSGDALEMAVGARSTLRNQQFLEHTYLREILERRGVTDWTIKCKNIEITDEIKEVQLKTQKVDLASRMADLGYKHRMDGDGEFIFDQVPQDESEGEPQDIPEEPNMTPADQTNTPAGVPDQKRTSDVGGRVAGQPGAGPNSSSNMR